MYGVHKFVQALINTVMQQCVRKLACFTLEQMHIKLNM